MSKSDQQYRLSKINKLVEEYNTQKQLNEPKSDRLIVDTHNYGCRCSTCWYKYDGASRENEQAPSTIYTDIYNSDTRFFKN